MVASKDAVMECIDRPEEDLDAVVELEVLEEFNISSIQGLCWTFVSSPSPTAAEATVDSCLLSSSLAGNTNRTVHDSLRFSLEAVGITVARAKIIAIAIAMASSTSDCVGGFWSNGLSKPVVGEYG